LHSFFAKDEIDVIHETISPRHAPKDDALVDIGMLLTLSKCPMKATEKLEVSSTEAVRHRRETEKRHSPHAHTAL
jgi:metal-sulfur cluster biosynthetic enzyme